MPRVFAPIYFFLLCSAFLANNCYANKAVSMRILYDSSTIKANIKTQLVAEIKFSNNSRTRESVNWISGNNNTAKIDSNGIITGANPGETTITAQKYDITAQQTFQIISSDTKIPDGFIRVHYYRYDNNYSGWGIHLWGKAITTPTSWDAPLPFNGDDAFGKYRDIQIQNPAESLSFIIHSKEYKDIGSNRNFTMLQQNREFWLKSDYKEVWTAQPTTKPEFLYAQFLNNQTIKAVLNKDSYVNVNDISLQNNLDLGIEPKSIQQNGREIIIYFESPLNLNATNYKLSFSLGSIWVHLGDELLNNTYFYNGDDLGATLTNTGALVKLWSPPATRVKVNIFQKNNSDYEVGSQDLTLTNAGVWTANLQASDFGLATLDGYFYQYEITALGQTNFALDPYAKSMAGYQPNGKDTVGKAAFINIKRGSPNGFRADNFKNGAIMANPVDMIAYETHVRDFTIDPALDIEDNLKGTYLGFEKKIDYLKDLGITHVQLLPVQNFVTVNEFDKKYRDGTTADFNYNWGYDPHNYFTPEGWYSTNPADPYARVVELKHLIQTLHENNLGVIMDVVYNHTFSSEIFENVCPGCYYRTDYIGRISGFTGAGPTVESRRKMVRKLIIDSLKYFVTEYHVDGFRFDLMGFLDKNTMYAIRSELGNDIILHGEAWEFTDLPPNEATTKSNLPHEAKIGAFSDTTRDSIAGFMDSKGFAQGNLKASAKAHSAIIGNIIRYNSDYNRNGLSDALISNDKYDRFAVEPIENTGYLSIHDGYTLWDKINLSYKGTANDRSKIAKLAYAMLFTGQGRIILHAGDEIARTKPLMPFDPNPDRAHTSSSISVDSDLPYTKYFHENSYQSPDATNMIRWSRAETIGLPLLEYTKSLIKMRRTLPFFTLPTSSSINNFVKFIGETEEITPQADSLAGYKSFTEVPNLTINFVNGPANTTTYISGEIYDANYRDKNPEVSKFPLSFDETGAASVTFTQEQIATFDLQGWTDPENLQIKLVFTPGQWNFQDGTYSLMGNNIIKPYLISKNNSININLAEKDCVAGQNSAAEKPYIAYEINMQGSNYVGQHAEAYPNSHIIVAHNTSPKYVSIRADAITNPGNWTVIFDERGFNQDGLLNSKVQISQKMIVMPPKSSAVLSKQNSN